MLDALIQLSLFSAKAIILVILILVLLAGILALLGRGKEKITGRINIKNISKKYAETSKSLMQEILPKKEFKQFIKKQKTETKSNQKNVYVINFNGDIKATAVGSLREEVTAILGIAKPGDEVVVKLESGGGMVHAYGLATSQLLRLRNQNIPLTIAIDKVAASGGYMMACVADKILAAPFSIVGSIGVVVQMPNFHRLLAEKNIDFEQLTAGDYKRTLTMFGMNTPEGREKLQSEINEIHAHFKNLITRNRSQVDINKVATGEHWLGEQALDLKLVDEIKTSDDYLLEKSKEATIFEIGFAVKKSLAEKLFSSAAKFKSSFFSPYTVI